jgi:hypothetical protein
MRRIRRNGAQWVTIFPHHPRGVLHLRHRGELWIPRPLRVQHDDPDRPHHRYASAGEQSGSLNHQDGHGMDCGTPA